MKKQTQQTCDNIHYSQCACTLFALYPVIPAMPFRCYGRSYAHNPIISHSMQAYLNTKLMHCKKGASKRETTCMRCKRKKKENAIYPGDESRYIIHTARAKGHRSQNTNPKPVTFNMLRVILCMWMGWWGCAKREQLISPRAIPHGDMAPASTRN